jgi:hypothetical protein
VLAPFQADISPQGTTLLPLFTFLVEMHQVVHP